MAIVRMTKTFKFYGHNIICRRHKGGTCKVEGGCGINQRKNEKKERIIEKL